MKASIPREIKKYRSNKVPITKVTIGFIIVGFTLGIILYFCLIKVLSVTITGLLSTLVACAISCLGFLEAHGLNSIQILKILIEETFFHANFRPYKIGGINNEKET